MVSGGETVFGFGWFLWGLEKMNGLFHILPITDVEQQGTHLIGAS